MPPWKASPASADFIGQRLLTDARDRADPAVGEAGAPEGDPATACRAAPTLTGGSSGTPDLIVTFPEPVHAAAQTGRMSFAFS